MFQLSTEVHRIKPACAPLSNEKQRVGFTTFLNRKEIQRSHRAQVVRSYTCVATTDAIFLCPSEPRSSG